MMVICTTPKGGERDLYTTTLYMKRSTRAGRICTAWSTHRHEATPVAEHEAAALILIGFDDESEWAYWAETT